MNKRNKKLLILMSIIVGLYVLATVFGLNREDSGMGKAMTEVRAVVADTRKKIQKEMDKPFILRLFGSLFGMEGNSFQGMKEKLPKILEDAMPTSVVSFSAPASTNEIACAGMRLGDALQYLYERKITMGALYWTFDKTETAAETKAYIQLSGSILIAEKDKDGKAILVLQMNHNFNGEDGIGTSEKQKSDARTTLSLLASDHGVKYLSSWFTDGQQGDAESKLLKKGVPLVQWKTLSVQWVESAKAVSKAP